MSRKNRQRKRTNRTVRLPGIIFTLASARMLKDALRYIQEHLEEMPDKPNGAFAIEVVGTLRHKIDDMLEGEDWEKETPLDYNEIHLLYAAAHMWLVHLSVSHNEQAAVCLQLCKQISQLVGRIEG